jgi:8-oxo-dGTP diphosphatase
MATEDMAFYRVSAKALIFDKSGKRFAVILEDNGWWELPGGGLDWGESVEECITREVKEEMGLTVIEVAKDPCYYMIGKNMSDEPSLNLVFETKVKDYNFIPSIECMEMKFISIDEVDTINAYRNVKELVELMKNK